MQKDGLSGGGDTKILAYGGVVSSLSIMAGGFFISTDEGVRARIALGAIAALLLLEGFALITNWRAGSEEVAAMIRGRPTKTSSLVAMHIGRTAFVRNTLGPLFFAVGAIYLWSALR